MNHTVLISKTFEGVQLTTTKPRSQWVGGYIVPFLTASIHGDDGGGKCSNKIMNLKTTIFSSDTFVLFNLLCQRYF